MRLLPVAIAVCLATPAWADLNVYSRSGGWDVFRGTGGDRREICGIGSTNPTDGRAFSLRFSQGDEQVTFVASKPNWHIPDGTQVPVVIQIGLERPWTERGVGHQDRIDWTMDRETVQTFDAQFSRAASMTVTFPAGSEPPWVVSLTGSSAASNAMGRCVRAMMQQGASAPAPATQGNTQPYAAPPTQPTPASPPAKPQ